MLLTMMRCSRFIFPRIFLIYFHSNFWIHTVNGDYGLNKDEYGICQVYNGTTCEKYLKDQSVFIPPNLTMSEIEERLKAAVGVIRESKDMNPNCRGYALPSLCYSTLPICRMPERTNFLYFAKRAEHRERVEAENQTVKHEKRGKRFLDKHFKEKIIFARRRKPPISTYDDITTEFPSKYPPSRESEYLRRICRDECELLENELCQKEYAIAKRHPTIGQKLPLEDCHNLPHSNDCSSFGIAIDVQPEQKCFWENGSGYRGTVAVSTSGKPCLRWSWLMKEISDFPELAGQNFCRNPGNSKERPWCFVDDNSYEKAIEHCDIPRCADQIWMYIFIAFGGIVGILGFSLAYYFYVKTKTKEMAIIQNHQPSADKNIYGSSQHNSLELSRLNGTNGSTTTTTTMTTTAPSLTGLTGNGLISASGTPCHTLDRNPPSIRVPQYTLQDVEFVEELGEGAFGKVYKGQLNQSNGEKIFVAVKALKENASAKTQQDFRREIELISELKHDNIVCILGVVLNKEPFCMLFEYMSQGDLHEYLIANSPIENKSLQDSDFLYIALQISEGMEYLSGHHYVHRDLAARNCLVGDNMCVKISDFGLSRDIYSSDYYRVQSKSLLPVRWMPSESILYGKFTTESDVWSFGVVLWEIYSYGVQPYYGYSNPEVITMIRQRQLLACPDICPTQVYSLMIECWHQQAIKRPSFSDISHRLRMWYQANKKVNPATLYSNNWAFLSQVEE